MAAPRILPPTQELRKLVEAGLTHADIVEHLRETSGLMVSRSAVSSALSRAGLTKETPRYREEVPWKVRGEHLTEYPVRMLRLLGRRRAGFELSGDEAVRLDAWLEGLKEKSLVVAYAPDAGGFLYVDDDEVDDGKGGIPIRTRIVTPDEIVEDNRDGVDA